MKDERARVFRGGVPYGPQVRDLEAAFPRPEEDSLILHERLEEIIREAPGTQRYYGVVNSWRSKLFNELGIDTDWIQGEGLKILTPADRLSTGERNFKSKWRGVKRAIRRTAATPRERLNEIGQQRYDHNLMAMAKLKAAGDLTQKQIAIDLAPVKSLPRPLPEGAK